MARKGSRSHLAVPTPSPATTVMVSEWMIIVKKTLLNNEMMLQLLSMMEWNITRMMIKKMS